MNEHRSCLEQVGCFEEVGPSVDPSMIGFFRRVVRRLQFVFIVVALLRFTNTLACGQIDIENEPFNYGKNPTENPVSKLQADLDAGTVTLEFDDEHGYLSSVLNSLGIKLSSQVLVNSKTSFQLRRISPERPRALYFNDESYVGWVQGGDVIELMTTDPNQGEVFYTLAQRKSDHPRFVLDKGQCISCHASSRTKGVPGGLVRSVFVSPSGQPHFGAGTFTIDHESPFSKRWGGWYVTGTHGQMRHMGNVLSNDQEAPERLDRDAGANIRDLSGLLDVTPYLSPHSDIVALMVLEHQTQMQNLITRANYVNRSASHHDGIMNSALDRPADYVSDTTERRIAEVGDKLLRYMLFVNEFRLEAPVRGTSRFAEDFQSLGPHDSHGRSLRDLDLETRMFKYPCSYLIYSTSFEQLPKRVKSYVLGRLHDVLTANDHQDEFAHLSAVDRKAIFEILSATKPRLWDR